MMPKSPQRSTLVLVVLVSVGVTPLTFGCNASLDLDVTLSTKLDLSDALDVYADDSSRPSSGGAVQVVEATDIDLSEEISQGKIRRIDVKEIWIGAPSNDLSTDLLRVSVFVGPQGASKPGTAGVMDLAELERIEAGEPVYSQAVILQPVHARVLGEQLATMHFSVLVSTYVPLEPVPEPLPTGSVEIEVDVVAEAILE